jgi:hypothetical protein
MLLSDESWVAKLAYLSDIFSYLNGLDKKKRSEKLTLSLALRIKLKVSKGN